MTIAKALADVAMGVILGIFLVAVVARVWPAVSGVAATVVLLSVGILLASLRPGGSLRRPG